jgi:hypothetical protein
MSATGAELAPDAAAAATYRGLAWSRAHATARASPLQLALAARVLAAMGAALTEPTDDNELDDPGYCGSTENFWYMVESPIKYAALALSLIPDSATAPKARWARALAVLCDAERIGRVWDLEFGGRGGMSAARYIPKLQGAERAAVFSGKSYAEGAGLLTLPLFRAYERTLDEILASAGDTNTKLCRFRGPTQDNRDAIVARLQERLEFLSALAARSGGGGGGGGDGGGEGEGAGGAGDARGCCGGGMDEE